MRLTALYRTWLCAMTSWASWSLLVSASAAQATTTRPPSAAAAEAQPTGLSDSLMGQAKLDYEAGRILIDDEDYVGAALKFKQAFEHSGDVRLLWNMAVCEKNLRHYAAVLALVERYRREGAANMTSAQRAEANDVLETVRTLISTVQVIANEPGAALFIDEQPVGTTPLTEPLLVDMGSRRIRIAKAGFKEQVITQNFTGGSSTTLNVTLRPDVQEGGRLSVFADGAAIISVDGSPVGGGHWEGALPVGEHALHVAASGMHSYRNDIVVSAGETRTLHITLHPEASGVPAWVWVGVGVVAAGGLATGAYFLLHSSQRIQTNEVVGSWSPGVIPLP